MTKLFTSAALIIALSLPALANAGEKSAKRSFTRDGQTYVYTVEQKKRSVVLDGWHYPSGRTFQLVVRGDHVRGVSAGVPVDFSIRTANTEAIQVASR